MLILHLYCVHSSVKAHPWPSPKRNHLSFVSIVSFQARTPILGCHHVLSSAVLCLHHAHLSMNACPLLPLCLSEHEHLSSAATTSLRARAVVLHLHHVYLSMNTHPWSQLCSPEHHCSSLATTTQCNGFQGRTAGGAAGGTGGRAGMVLCSGKHQYKYYE